jgi:hypothetical protein
MNEAYHPQMTQMTADEIRGRDEIVNEMFWSYRFYLGFSRFDA